MTALDNIGNIVTGYAGTIHFSSPDPQAILPPDYTFKPSDNGVATFSATFLTPGNESLTARDVSDSGIMGQATFESSFPVPSGPVSGFGIDNNMVLD